MLNKRIFKYGFLLLFLTLLFITCAKTKKETYLRDLADTKNFLIGGLYHDYHIRKDNDGDKYAETLSSEFNMMSTTYSFGMDEVWLSKDEYKTEYMDYALKFASDNNMTLRGTHLTWHESIPEWLTNSGYSDAEVESLVRTYITNIVKHTRDTYSGVLKYWNVVNEVIDTSSGTNLLRDTFFKRKIGTDYISKFFIWAHSADTNAVLYLNDYDALGNRNENSTKADKLYRVVTNLLNSGVPINGVGFQAHLTIDDYYDMDYNKEVLQRFTALGLEVQLTELDVTINDNRGCRTKAKLYEQAELYKKFIDMALSVAGCTGVCLWGVTDKYHYINRGDAYWLKQKIDWPLLFDWFYKPKPAYFSVTEALK